MYKGGLLERKARVCELYTLTAFEHTIYKTETYLIERALFAVDIRSKEIVYCTESTPIEKADPHIGLGAFDHVCHGGRYIASTCFAFDVWAIELVQHPEDTYTTSTFAFELLRLQEIYNLESTWLQGSNIADGTACTNLVQPCLTKGFLHLFTKLGKQLLVISAGSAKRLS